MQIFERPGGAYEQVVFCEDDQSGLKAIIAIHSTALGPSLGGTRFYPYATEDLAVEDALRLAVGMTYKSAAAGLPLGGGKAVIIGDPETLKSDDLLTAYARFVESLSGRYITAEDVGTTTDDMNFIQGVTSFVTGVSEDRGGSGDPSPATAYGVLHAMRTVANELWGSQSLDGRHVVITGVGKVGYALAEYLAKEGARLSVSDVNQESLDRVRDEFGATVVPLESAHTVTCDIYSPCALGASLNTVTIPSLDCAAVVGSANNQLADESCIELLAKQNVLYAPDYVVNAGGVINIADEVSPGGYDRNRAYERVAGIYGSTKAVLETAKREEISTALAADRVAERRIAEEGKVGSIRTFRGGNNG